MRVQSLALCAVSVVCLTGCPSFSAMGLARPLKQGSMQTVVAPEGFGTRADLGMGPQLVLLPQMELAIRYGITDNFEMGAKLWLIGAALEGKLGLLQSPTMDSGLDLSLSPSLSYLGITSSSGLASLTTISLPVQIGINFGGNQLVFSPRVVDFLFIVGGTTGNLVSVGGSLGFAFKVGPEFRVMPEISTLYPVAAGGGGGVGAVSTTNPLVQVGVGLMFGGRYDSAQPALPP